MAEVNSLFKKLVNSPLRNSGTIHYCLCLDHTGSSFMHTFYENMVNTSSSRSSSDEDIATSSVLDRCLLRCRVATLDQGSWLLDGSSRSVNNRDVQYQPISSDPGIHYAMSSVYSDNQGLFGDIKPKITVQAHTSDTHVVNASMFRWSTDIDNYFCGWLYPFVDKFQIAWDLQSKDMGTCSVCVHYVERADIIKMYSDRVAQDSYRDIYTSQMNISESNIVKDENTGITTVLLGEPMYIVGIDITIESWSKPGSRAVVTEILFDDFISDFTSDLNITRVENSKQIDIFNNDNPQYTCNVSIDNAEKLMDPLGRSGIISKLRKGLPFYMQFGILTDSDLNGASLEVLSEIETWYLISWKVSEDTYTVTLQLGSEADLVTELTTYHREQHSLKEYYSSLGLCSEMLNDGVPIIHKYMYPVGSYFRYRFADKYPTYIQNSTDLVVPLDPEAANIDIVKQAALISAGGCVCTVDSSTGLLVLKYLKDLINSDKWILRSLPEECVLSAPQITESVQSVNYSITYKEQTYNADVSEGGYLRCKWIISPDERHTALFDLNEMFGSDERLSAKGDLYSVTDPEWAFFMDDTHFPNLHTTAVIFRGRTLKIDVENTTGSTVEVDFNFRVFGLYQDNKFVHEVSADSSTSEIVCSMCGSYAQSLLISSNFESLRKFKNTIEFEYTGDPSLEPGEYIHATTDYGECLILITETSLVFDGSYSGKLKGYVYSGLDN